jgi:NTP pyrophosphatase (non-canonical NTP hydrolase)
MNPQQQAEQSGLEMGNFKLPSGLTVAQEARIKKLIEELNEASKAAAKILNYGFSATYKGVTYDNRADLEKELGDVRAVTRMLTRKGDLTEGVIAEQMVAKCQQLRVMIPFEQADDSRINPLTHP